MNNPNERRELIAELRKLDCQRQSLIDAINTIDRRRARRRLKKRIGCEIRFSQGCATLIKVSRTKCEVDHWLGGARWIDLLDVDLVQEADQ